MTTTPPSSCDCDACVAMDVCVDCHDTIEGTRHFIPTDEDEQFWMGKPAVTGPLCSACVFRRDNAEPPDPDGEDLFRDYQAEFRDSMIEAQRLK